MRLNDDHWAVLAPLIPPPNQPAPSVVGHADPTLLIGDKAYDSDGLDADLAALRIEMIAPNRRNRWKTQDGRPLRLYRRR